MPKIEIAEKGNEYGRGHNPRIDHLRPVIEFLLAQGNKPAGWRGDMFWYDQGGDMHYTFTNPINVAQLREQFIFPVSIRVYENGFIRDILNLVDISQERPLQQLTTRNT
jgi:hypothetical protein